MLHHPTLIRPSGTFWQQVASILVEDPRLSRHRSGTLSDLSSIRVVVPTFAHARQLKLALAQRWNGAGIPPRITTLSAWLAMSPPTKPSAGAGERLMSLYAELRRHAWLKTLFTAKRNTDLLPLARTLLALSDELTQTLLPTIRASGFSEEDWQSVIDKLPSRTRNVLSEEAQLVWSIWKSQLDGNDAIAMRFDGMMALAKDAVCPLLWVDPGEPDASTRAFLEKYARRQIVMPVQLDWKNGSVDSLYANAWPGLCDTSQTQPDLIASLVDPPSDLFLYAAKSLEDEAIHGAQTVVDWIAEGKSSIGIIVQNRVVARRIRALLERAGILVADETGWKLSTTRAAAAVAAWFEVVSARADTFALLDLLKSPFVFPDAVDKADQVMSIEIRLRQANVLGGWNAVTAALVDAPSERTTLLRIAHQAARFEGRKPLSGWIEAMHQVFETLGMQAAFAQDEAGRQVIAMLDGLEHASNGSAQLFSLAEWRSFLSMQLEETPFVPVHVDQRVMMLPLNGARLRRFDAALVVGADADHLPSRSDEALFFSNAVRRELGLRTREDLQRQQLRDFAELLVVNRPAVISWQAHRNGEPNPPSPWIARLQLALARTGGEAIPGHSVDVPLRDLTANRPVQPAPSAPQLAPERLSASAFNCLIACPYQFFATRMLRLSWLDDLSDMPQKRDYGDWLHEILKRYHESVRDHQVRIEERTQLLTDISEEIFRAALDKTPAALGYYARWQKAIPSYIAWANERESQGWHFVAGEQWFEKRLHWTEGEIMLHGRIDRIDRNADGEHHVLDYKTSSQQALRTRLVGGEDHQLAFYGMLADVPITSAHYVGLEPVKERIGAAEASRYAERLQLLKEHIIESMHAVLEGAPLPANGTEPSCLRCEVRGLCRKGTWDEHS